jgi:diaminohydroxyphosphoribosylaminopyrimidine deaminase/5-amino-6-(5-phosphoribosylamino)uracil reductase
MFSRFDHECMAKALRLAHKGLYTTDPNPRVGCVIAGGDQIVGTGWHQKAGGKHAEVAAIEDAGTAARDMTAYVTLEPCNHHGRTPPCTDALINAGIKRVVIASMDPNPRVKGSGQEKLLAAGLEVQSGLLAQQAEALNTGFMTRMKSGRPWVRIKSAISLDGRSALKNGKSQWISCEASRADVQRWRARSSAILTGIGTVLADDPSMDARVEAEVEQPVKVIADSHWRTPPDSRILASQGKVLIAGDGNKPVPEALATSAAHFLRLQLEDGQVDLQALLASLGELEINEVQVEAGSLLCGALLKKKLVDEILLYQAPVLLGDGGPAPFAIGPLESMEERTQLRVLETTHLDKDLRIRLQPESRH